MPSQYDQHMKRWGGLESSFDGTVPPSRLAPVTMMKMDIEAYDGASVTLTLCLNRSGLFTMESTAQNWKASGHDMLAFFEEGAAQMRGMLEGGE